MTAATLARIDQRAKDVVSVPRSTLESSWMDVQALTFEARRDVARAYVAEKRGVDPVPSLFDADRRLVRLDQYARRQAAEAAGITFLTPGQLALPLADGCGPRGRSA